VVEQQPLFLQAAGKEREREKERLEMAVSW
jgi:hypothetical protein